MAKTSQSESSVL